MVYYVFKFIHVLGVIILIGNVTITAFWKVLADRTRDPILIAHAQQGVTIADWIFTLAGIVLILSGGYGAAHIGNFPVFELNWLVIGQLLFVASGLIWLTVLVPLQIRQSSASRHFRPGNEIGEDYWRDARSWLVWGVVATIPLFAAIWIMIAKPR